MAFADSRRPHRTSTRGVWWWALAGAALGMVGALVQFAPAAWVQAAAQSASKGRVLLSDSRGTVWHGSASLALGGGSGSTDAMRLPGRVQWDLRPGMGKLQIDLRADCCAARAQQLTLTPALRGWQLQLAPGESTWPAAVLAGLGTPWNTVGLQGPLVFNTPGLTVVSAVDRVRVEGSMSLDMPNLSSSLSTLRPLGSYRLLLQGGDQPALDLRTVQGSLHLQGTGRWTAAHLRFVGEARADADHEAELSNLLNIMGQRDGARSVITLG